MQNGDVIEGNFTGRQEGEAPRKQLWVKGKGKQPAKSVWIVCYRHDVLGAEAETTCEWEIISINASPSVENEPAPTMILFFALWCPKMMPTFWTNCF